jgi:ubiquinone biosynthesis protein
MSPEASPSLVGVAVRDLARLRDVAAKVASHGFGELLARTPLGLRLFGGAPPKEDAALAQATPAVRLTRLLASLGPTFIKLGQILSMRRDLLPAEYIAALETLQDAAPVVDFATVRAQVESGLGAPLGELFAAFEEKALATASIAQTHLATTHGGERVVVKVQRPGIEPLMRGDLDLLYLAAQVLEASIDEMQLLGVTAVVQEFEKGLLRELDFREELSNLMTARELLDRERQLTVPRPYPELSSKTVLTMQFFQGRALRTLEPGSELAKRANDEVVHGACKQVFLDGFFHGDPHAGNLLIADDGTLCLLDYGLVGRLSEDERDDLVTLVLATIANDSGTIARSLLKMGTPTQRVNLADLRAEIERIRGKYLVAADLSQVDTTAFAREFAEAAQRFRIKLAPEYSILTKAATTVEGLIRTLHPQVDLAGIATPYVRQIMARRFAPQAILSDLASEASGLAGMARRLPAQIDQILHDVETGSFQVRAVTPALDELPNLAHQLGGKLGLGLFAFAMTLATAVLLGAADFPAWRVVLAIACGLTAAGAWTVLFWWHVAFRGKPLRLGPWIRLFRR